MAERRANKLTYYALDRIADVKIPDEHSAQRSAETLPCQETLVQTPDSHAPVCDQCASKYSEGEVGQDGKSSGCSDQKAYRTANGLALRHKSDMVSTVGFVVITRHSNHAQGEDGVATMGHFVPIHYVGGRNHGDPLRANCRRQAVTKNRQAMNR